MFGLDIFKDLFYQLLLWGGLLRVKEVRGVAVDQLRLVLIL